MKLEKSDKPIQAIIPDSTAPSGGFFVKLLSTFFYTGFLPKAPGTWASAATAIILFFIWPKYWHLQFLITLAVYLIGVELSARAEKYYGHDGNRIVIDEVAGQMTALFMMPRLIIPFVMAFALFRLFDIFKPPPARTWESLPYGWGIMSDDIAAGFYAAIVTHFLLALLNKWGVSLV
jgi:phosphatidylglycerophosphatase A